MRTSLAGHARRTRPGLTVSGITLNGTPVAYSVETIKGIQYAIFSAILGTYQVVFTGSGL